MGTSKSNAIIPSVSIAEGAHKYVLISANEPTKAGNKRRFVVSAHGAPYHRNVAEPFVERLERMDFKIYVFKVVDGSFEMMNIKKYQFLDIRMVLVKLIMNCRRKKLILIQNM